MINIRYHVYSLVAVFLALAIGVAAGSTVVQRSVVDNLRSTQGRIEQNLGIKLADRFNRLDHRQRVAIAVTTHRDQVGYVTEQRPEDIAAQADTFFRQPYHEAIGRLPAWCRMQLEVPATDCQLELLVDDDRRNWRALCR